MTLSRSLQYRAFSRAVRMKSRRPRYSPYVGGGEGQWLQMTGA